MIDRIRLFAIILLLGVAAYLAYTDAAWLMDCPPTADHQWWHLLADLGICAWCIWLLFDYKKAE